jgi:hypothetical protein
MAGYRLLTWALIALALGCMVQTNASAATVNINFIENPNGSISVTGNDRFGNAISFLKPDSEEFHLSSPAVSGLYPVDATAQGIGISTVGGDLLFGLKDAGGRISDYIRVYQFDTSVHISVMDFFSDPIGGAPGPIPNAVLENGGLQFVGSYLNDRGDTVNLSIQSIDATTPLPAALPLFASGLAGLGWFALRRRKQAVA